MQVIGKDNSGNLIGVERGLISSTLYRSHGLHDASGLGGLDDLGFDWDMLFTFINENPVVQGVGAKIAGGHPTPGQPQPNPYLLNQGFQQPSASASISPMLLIGGLGLAAILLLKK